MSAAVDVPFAIVPEWLLMSGVGGNAVLVFAVLHRHVDRDAECWPSLNRLASMSGMSNRTIQRALDDLEELGAIERVGRTRDDGSSASNLYKLHMMPPEGYGAGAVPTARVSGGYGAGVRGGTARVSPHEGEPIERNPENERGAVAPTRPISLFGGEGGKPRHKPITEKWLEEQQALHPKVDVRLIYEQAQNRKTWDGYRDKRRALRDRIGWAEERAKGDSREPERVAVDVDDWQPRQGMLG